MKIKTSELSGEALNYAVAVAMKGKVITYPEGGFYPPEGSVSFGDEFLLLLNDGEGHVDFWTPDYDWSQGGPLFDEYCETFHRDKDGTIWAAVGLSACKGSTILEAFCRALVTERSGPEVEVPDELVRETSNEH